jgi:Mycothiol maleylpyruvate isomerase N-terminal domain
VSAEDDKRTALGLLEREWHALDAWLRALDDKQLDRPMFGEAPGWRVRDMVTHMAWWQELAGRVAEKVATAGGAPDERGSRPFLGIETPLDELNATTFETWRAQPMAARWDRWLATHSRMMDAFRALAPDQLLQTEGGMDGMKRYFAVPGLIHLRMHRENIEAALKETSTT